MRRAHVAAAVYAGMFQTAVRLFSSVLHTHEAIWVAIWEAILEAVWEAIWEVI